MNFWELQWLCFGFMLFFVAYRPPFKYEYALVEDKEKVARFFGLLLFDWLAALMLAHIIVRVVAAVQR